MIPSFLDRVILRQQECDFNADKILGIERKIVKCPTMNDDARIGLFSQIIFEVDVVGLGDVRYGRCFVDGNNIVKFT